MWGIFLLCLIMGTDRATYLPEVALSIGSLWCINKTFKIALGEYESLQ